MASGQLLGEARPRREGMAGAASSRLNADPDPGHFSYRVIGMLSWSVLILAFIGLVMAPRLLLELARWVAFYMMLRLITLTAFYLAGLVRVRLAEKRAAGFRGDLSADQVSGHGPVHHLVVLPNFAEPGEVLSRTLRALSGQPAARESMTVVLAMEEREPGARDKAEALLTEFRGRFYCLFATYHPADLPGELPGKGMNEAWAVRAARRELVERLGIPVERIVVTVADSDSVIHPLYFAELRRQFASEPGRYSMIWQAPMLLDNDIWQAHATIRLLTYYTNVVAMGDYTNSWEPKVPYSTYSISLRLLEEAGYWDPRVIDEDVNIFLRAFFKRGGRAYIRRTFLPAHGNPVYGADLWQAMRIFYAQKVRHGWGAAEIGYVLQKWNYPPGASFFQKTWRLLKLLHDHLFFSTAGIIVTLGVAISIALDHTAAITMPAAGVNSLALVSLNILGAGALVVIWLAERMRLSRGRLDWSPRSMLSEILPLLFLPVIIFLLMNVPVLEAQTRMLLGQPFYFKRTPKGWQAKLED